MANVRKDVRIHITRHTVCALCQVAETIVPERRLAPGASEDIDRTVQEHAQNLGGGRVFEKSMGQPVFGDLDEWLGCVRWEL